MRWCLAVGVLWLGAGCARSFAPSLLPEHQSPQNHPPDGSIIARETRSRAGKALNIAFMKAAPVIDWALLGVMVALQPYGSLGGITNGLCTVGPSCRQPTVLRVP
jgi:hypothetical protein